MQVLNHNEAINLALWTKFGTIVWEWTDTFHYFLATHKESQYILLAEISLPAARVIVDKKYAVWDHRSEIIGHL